jgi:hypothetical protein
VIPSTTERYLFLLLVRIIKPTSIPLFLSPSFDSYFAYSCYSTCKVALFTLAVSDVVIVNVREQTNNGMSKDLEVCAKALTCLHDTKVPQPIIFFVQHQRPNQCIFSLFPFPVISRL